MIRRYIKKMQANGWLVSHIDGSTLHFKCAKHGCSGSARALLDNPGNVLAPCNLPHVMGYAEKSFDDYRDLISEFRDRRVCLGLNQDDLATAMGFPDGYVAKLESFAKVPTPATLAIWATALGTQITLIPAQLPPATIKAIDERRASPYAIHQARFKHAKG